MSEQQPDYSFIRDGLSLEDWLWKLVDDSKAMRVAAGEALQAMEWGLPSAHIDWGTFATLPDIGGQSRRFAEAVKEIFAGDSFNSARFLEKLGALRLGMSHDWRKRVDAVTTHTNARDEKYDRIAERLVETINSTADETEKTRAEKRLAKLSAIYIAGSCNETADDPFQQAESIAPSGVAATRIFHILDVELLSAPDVLEIFLRDSSLRFDALSALQRCGPAAVAFAPLLLDDFDQLARTGGKSDWFDASDALGNIGEGNPDIVEAVVSRLTHKKSSVRRGAADVLRHMGGEVCGRNDEICQLLLPLLDDEETWCIALFALASVGRDIPEIRAKVLAMAAPREPKLRAYPGYPHMEFDQTMHERGNALSAIEYLTSYPDECLPVLIEALETFEEFDPDEGYHGPHGRISDVIARFGSDAESVALPLARHLEDEPEELVTAILDCLVSLGPAARDALPALQALHEKFSPDTPAEADALPDRDDDQIGWVIHQITSQTPPESK